MQLVIIQARFLQYEENPNALKKFRCSTPFKTDLLIFALS